MLCAIQAVRRRSQFIELGPSSYITYIILKTYINLGDLINNRKNVNFICFYYRIPILLYEKTVRIDIIQVYT